MSVVVFVGPTMRAAAVRDRLPEAVVRGPASCGDLFCALHTRPRALALIDGSFDHRLAPWHKEILWALAQGVSVYGAASMGAATARTREAW